MKKWEQPEVEELEIRETMYSFIGIYRDGGTFGDGIISGHLGWKPSQGGGPGQGGGCEGGIVNEPSL